MLSPTALAHRACDDAESEQPALDGAIPQRRAPLGLEADQLGEPQVAGEADAAVQPAKLRFSASPSCG